MSALWLVPSQASLTPSPLEWDPWISVLERIRCGWGNWASTCAWISEAGKTARGRSPVWASLLSLVHASPPKPSHRWQSQWGDLAPARIPRTMALVSFPGSRLSPATRFVSDFCNRTRLFRIFSYCCSPWGCKESDTNWQLNNKHDDDDS